ncbi:MAG: sugar-binding protein [Bacteroidota bacterium]
MKYYNYKFALIIVFIITFSLLSFSQDSQKKDHKITEVYKSTDKIKIDGIANEADWEEQKWFPIDQIWLGEPFAESDFKGRYKLLWTEEALFLLAEITDDILLDRFSDPLKNWWDEDCLEIFIDENNSGGDHQFNHSAFAYHVDTYGNVVDVTPSQEGKLYNSHVISKRVTKGNTSMWELKILLYDDSYTDDFDNEPQKLSAGKKVGFALAYCDNDKSQHRENFIGSSDHPGFKKDLGWKDASIFSTLILIDNN